MGKYANSLSKRLRGQSDKPAAVIDPTVERLLCVGIERDGQTYGIGYGFKEHYRLRAILDPALKDPYQTVRGDIDGFITTEKRFLNRRAAEDVAIEAGQLSGRLGRMLVSSDLNW